IKVGIYNPERKMCTTIPVLKSMIHSFERTSSIKVIESDSFAGPGLKRLDIWHDCYDDRVIPYNISLDEDTEFVDVAGELVPLSHILLKANSFISTHIPRRYENCGDDDLLNTGSIIKNLLGIIPDKKKFRFHKKLPVALIDIYEAIGGIDLAVLDGTFTFIGLNKVNRTVSSGFLVMGRDAFAVETVGAHMVGFEAQEMPVLQEAHKRGLGEINIENICIVGDIDKPRIKILEEFLTIQPIEETT
ncbi:MAG: DUF362 domain-containing protein, partial [Candidatus Kariarchaeaceae archaeon]